MLALSSLECDLFQTHQRPFTNNANVSGLLWYIRYGVICSSPCAAYDFSSGFFLSFRASLLPLASRLLPHTVGPPAEPELFLRHYAGHIDRNLDQVWIEEDQACDSRHVRGNRVLLQMSMKFERAVSLGQHGYCWPEVDGSN